VNFCTACGTRTQPAARFCAVCGAPIPVGVAPGPPAGSPPVAWDAPQAPPSPPVTATQVDNTLVWVLAFAPIACLIVSVALGLGATLGFLFTVGVNTALCSLDAQGLRRSGHDTSGITRNYWVVPVYLFKRAESLRHSNGYAIVWVVCFVISLI
jgi:zinc ribbon protein